MIAQQYLEANPGESISREEMRVALMAALDGTTLHKVLLVPPDISRSHSFAGPIVRQLYRYLSGRGVQVDILPALGSHVPMTADELDEMYRGIPHERFIVHDWRGDTVRLGEVPGRVTSWLSEGVYKRSIPVEVNSHILDRSYDLVLSIGQVVPHEVVGMASYNKNIFVGCGGEGMISASHYMGALYGMERMMGQDNTPLHRLFDYAQEHFLQDVPLAFVLTVTSPSAGEPNLSCLSIGVGRDTYEKAIAVSQKRNIVYLDRPAKKVVTFLEEREFKRTWIANKAIYRTRMIIADGGELLILAPGLCGCGEDPQNDRLLRKHGYLGRERVRALVKEDEELGRNLSAAAHMIHSSTEGRFSVTYAPGHMSREEIEGIGYNYMSLGEALLDYSPYMLRPGWQEVNGEEIFYVPNPAVGLWRLRE